MLRKLVAALAFVAAPALAGEAAHPLPAPALDATASAAGSETAVLAGGCFWGMQGVFQHVAGVRRVLAGYSGGGAAAARYDAVGSGTTGHAESVEIVFDPRQVSYARILQVYFSVMDPTTLDYQGPDYGSQYRSEIFAASDAQRRTAEAYIAQLANAHIFAAPIVTRVGTLTGFYAAEGYHQDYLLHHPDQPYIVVNDLPKIEKLKRFYPELYRGQPVTVAQR